MDPSDAERPAVPVTVPRRRLARRKSSNSPRTRISFQLNHRTNQATASASDQVGPGLTYSSLAWAHELHC